MSAARRVHHDSSLKLFVSMYNSPKSIFFVRFLSFYEILSASTRKNYQTKEKKKIERKKLLRYVYIYIYIPATQCSIVKYRSPLSKSITIYRNKPTRSPGSRSRVFLIPNTRYFGSKQESTDVNKKGGPRRRPFHAYSIFLASFQPVEYANILYNPSYTESA